MRHYIKLTAFITVLACFVVLPAFAGVCDPEGDDTVSLGEVICELQVLTGVRDVSSIGERRGSVEGYLVPEPGSADTTSSQLSGGIEVVCHYGDDQVMNTVTDPNGFFRFPDVPVGPAQIRVLNEGGPSAVFQVGVEVNKTIAVHFNLEPVPVILNGTIEGIVRTAGENGENPHLPETLIRLMPVIPDMTVGETGPNGENMMPPETDVWRVVTDQNGFYKIENIPVGYYMVSASKQGFKKMLSTVLIAGDRVLRQDFVLFSEHPAEYGTLFGSVAEKTTPEATMLSPFIPAPGAQVKLAPLPGQSTDGLLTAVTNEKGRFMFPKARIGDYMLIIEDSRFEPYERPVRIEADMPGMMPVIGPPPDDADDDPDGNADADNPGEAALFRIMTRAEIGFFCIGPHGNWHTGVNFVRVVLKRINAEEKAGLKGIVFFPDGNQRKPVPGAVVTLETFFPYPTLDPVLTDDGAFAPLPVYETKTDGEGIYRFDNLPPGEYHLKAEAPDFGSEYEPFHDMIRLMPGENHRDIALTPRMLCKDNSECPADGYCARDFEGCEGEGMCRKKPDACPEYYEPVCGCDNVTYGNKCEAAATGVTPAYEGECLPAGESAVLSGQITDGVVDCATGADCIAGIPGAFVEIFHLSPISSRPPFHTQTVTDENGYYKFPHIPISPDAAGTINPAEFQITASAAQYMKRTETITLTPGENTWSRELKPLMPCVAGDECGNGQFCARHQGDCEGPGICMEKPDGCYLMYDPVCGCDNNTYGNDCEANIAGVSVRYKGGCEDHPF